MAGVDRLLEGLLERVGAVFSPVKLYHGLGRMNVGHKLSHLFGRDDALGGLGARHCKQCYGNYAKQLSHRYGKRLSIWNKTE